MKTLKRVGFVVLAIIVLAGIASCFGSDDEGKESIKKEEPTEKVSTTEFTYEDKDVVLVNEGNTWHAEALGRRVPYTGTVQNEYGIWYVKDGLLAENYNGTGSYNGQDAVFRNGRVASETTGLISAGDHWYYVQAGIIQHGYTGLAKNSAGTWYVENGAVDFNKSGEYTENGVTYVISAGLRRSNRRKRRQFLSSRSPARGRIF